MMEYGHDGMGWWMLWGGVLWGFLVVGVVFIVVRLGGGSFGGGGPAGERQSPAGDAPLDIARRRYAAGEIGREEFEQIRRDLS